MCVLLQRMLTIGAVLVTLSAGAVHANMLGKDADGRSVILRSDGTWSYLDVRFENGGVAFDPVDAQHYYARSSGRATWSESRAVCRDAGGHLATVTSAAENAFLADHFDGGQRIWLGGTDAAREGVWRWVTGEPWAYMGWNEDEPNDAEAGEDYLELGSGGRWNDDGLPKQDRVFYFLCEFE